ncbi:MAG TPA: hypothetical protein VIW48_00690 [Nitrospiraceae bacterium]
MKRKAGKRSEHPVQVSPSGIRTPHAKDLCQECVRGRLVVKMPKLLRYHLKPLQIRSVAAQQAYQAQPSLQPSRVSHAAQDHAPRAEGFEFGIYCLLQNAIDRQLGEVYRSLGRDPPGESDVTLFFHGLAS